MTWEALIDVTYCQLSVVSIYIIVLRSKYQEHIKKNKIFLLSLDLWVFIEFVCHSHKDKCLVLSTQSVLIEILLWSRAVWN